MNTLNQSVFTKTRETLALISNRESTVLRLIAEGLSSREIASTLFITHETVKSHRKNIKSKLKARNTAALIKAAYDQRLLVPVTYQLQV